MCSQPRAAQTVTLPHPMTGDEIMNIVQLVVSEGQAQFVSERYYDDGDAYGIGQKSEVPYEHLKVVPVGDEETFRPAGKYEALRVISTSWGGMVYAIGYTEEVVISTVQRFAKNLGERFQ